MTPQQLPKEPGKYFKAGDRAAQRQHRVSTELGQIEIERERDRERVREQGRGTQTALGDAVELFVVRVALPLALILCRLRVGVGRPLGAVGNGRWRGVAATGLLAFSSS